MPRSPGKVPARRFALSSAVIALFVAPIGAGSLSDAVRVARLGGGRLVLAGPRVEGAHQALGLLIALEPRVAERVQQAAHQRHHDPAPRADDARAAALDR